MPNHPRTILFIATVILLSFAAYGQSPSAPDSTLYTTYVNYNQRVSWVVCGSTQQSEGCYSSGELGPFGNVGALVESSPSVKGNVVTRGIYVVDIAAGNGSEVTLYVYKKVDTISASYDSATVTLAKTVSLPLTGGSGVTCSMAANNKFLFIGTDQSQEPVEVSKSNFSVTQLGLIFGGTTAITADSYGYVTITQGNGFQVYGPNGEGEEDGGGSPFMGNTMIGATATTTLPLSDQPQRQVGYWPKK